MTGAGKLGYREAGTDWASSGWELKKLSELVDVVYGKSPAEIKKVDSGVPIYGTGGISGHTDTPLCNGPSIIFGRKGTIDKVQRCDGPFWAIDTTFYTSARMAFDWGWLYYAVSLFDLKKLNEASGVPSLSRASLEDLDIAVPPPPEQKKIAAILSAVDGKLDIISRQIESTRTLKQGLMQTLFTQGVGTRDANGCWVPHAKFRTAVSMKVPATWGVEQLGQIAPLIRRPVEVSNDEVYPELGLRSYGKGTFHKPALPGNEVGNKRLFEIKAGDLLFSNVFAWEGAVAVAKPEDDGRFGSHRYISCLVDSSRADTSFVLRFLTTPKGIELLTRASPGGAGRNRTLGLTALANITIPLPPLEEQRKVTEVLDSVDAKLQALTDKQSHYKTLKRGLMQKLLTGEWRVSLDTQQELAIAA